MIANGYEPVYILYISGSSCEVMSSLQNILNRFVFTIRREIFHLE
jgi:hypothetical protein